MERCRQDAQPPEAAAKQAADRPFAAGALRTPADVLHLQRAAGNRAVSRLIATRAPSARLQRAVGFEVELSVPTFGTDAVQLGDGPGGPPAPVIGKFFGGGLKYNSEIGGVTSAMNDRVKLKTDHDPLEERGKALYETIGTIGQSLAPKDGYKRLSNLEYVTDALDEMAPGSNDRFRALVDTIVAHAQALIGREPDKRVSPIDGAEGNHTGVPVDELRQWVGVAEEDLDAAFNKALKLLQKDIELVLYVQATAGVLPSSLATLYQAHEPPGAPSTFKEDVRRATADGVRRLLQDAGFQQRLRAWETRAQVDLNDLDREALGGLLHLALAWDIGSAVNQTNLVKSSNKNAFDLLFKMRDVGQVKDLITDDLALLGQGQGGDAFFTYVANWFQQQVAQTRVTHWTTQWVAAPAVGDSERIPAYGRGPSGARGTTKDMLKQLLTGKGGANLAIRSTNPLNKGDKRSELLPRAQYGGQMGIPLEYRWITDYPKSATALWGVFKTVLNEVRAANMVRLDQATRNQIKATWGPE